MDIFWLLAESTTILGFIRVKTIGKIEPPLRERFLNRETISMIDKFNPFTSALQEPSLRAKEDIAVYTGPSNYLIDGLRTVASIPNKIMLWNSKVGSGHVSNETIDKMRTFLHENNLHDVAIFADTYRPLEVCRRIFSNPKTNLLAKCTLGIKASIYGALPLSKLLGMDHYDPASNSVHISSDHLAIALHECGHAKDFNTKKCPMLYAGIETLTPWILNILQKGSPQGSAFINYSMTLHKEYEATMNARDYLRSKKMYSTLQNAWKVLIPAYMTYLASPIIPTHSAKEIASAGIQCITQQGCSSLKTILLHFLGIAAITLLGRCIAQICNLAENAKQKQQTDVRGP